MELTATGLILIAGTGFNSSYQSRVEVVPLLFRIALVAGELRDDKWAFIVETGE